MTGYWLAKKVNSVSLSACWPWPAVLLFILPSSHYGMLQRGTKRRESGWVDLRCAPTLRRGNCVMMSFCHKHHMALKHRGNTFVQAVTFTAVAPFFKKKKKITCRFLLIDYHHIYILQRGFPSPLHNGNYCKCQTKYGLLECKGTFIALLISGKMNKCFMI